MHFHLCDCGHEWSHDDADILTEEQNKREHTCSQCDKKMWWKKGKCPPPHLREQAERELETQARLCMLESLFEQLGAFRGNR